MSASETFLVDPDIVSSGDSMAKTVGLQKSAPIVETTGLQETHSRIIGYRVRLRGAKPDRRVERGQIIVHFANLPLCPLLLRTQRHLKEG